MGKLIYAANISLDGFLGDGSFDWPVPDEEVHAFQHEHEHERHIGTSLYGRRMTRRCASGRATG